MKIKYQYFTDTVPTQIIEKINNSSMIALDIETNLHLNPHDLDGKIRTVQIALSKNEIYIFDLYTLDKYDFLNYIFKDKVVLGQSLKFECKWLWKYNIDLSDCKWLFDTEIAARVIYNDQREDDFDDEDDDIEKKENKKKLSYSLKELCKRHLNIELDKELQTSDWGNSALTEDQLEYAAYDVYFLWDLREVFLPLIKEYDLVEILKIEFKHIFVSASLEYNGIYLDIEEWESYIPKYEQDILSVNKNLYQTLPDVYKQTVFYGDEIVSLNLGSNKQLLGKLQQYGIPTTSTSDKELSLYSREEYPILEEIKEKRQLTKLLDTYLKGYRKFVHPITNRIHCSIFQLGSKTGRISSTEPNMLNIPRGKTWRRCFKGQHSNYFLDIDYSQIESRLVAVEANELKMLDIFNNDLDIYAATAAIENNIEINEFLNYKKNNPEYFALLRQGAKSEVLGLCFGMGIHKYKDYIDYTFGIKKSVDEIKSQRFTFLNKTYPRLSQWHKECTKDYEKIKYLINRNNRRLWLYQPEYNVCINYRVQSLATDIIKDAFNTIFFYLKYVNKVVPLFDRSDIFQVAYVHDQGTWEGKQEVLEKFKPMIEDIMKFVGEKHIQYKVKIGSDGHIGNNWADSH